MGNGAGIDGMRAGGHSAASACMGQDLVVQALQGGAAAQGISKKNDDKNKIAICLKKKPPGGRGKVRSSSVSTPIVPADTPTDASALPPTSQVQKKHRVDMEKWSQRGKETHNSTDAAQKDGSNAICTIADDTSNSTSTEVKRTAQGKPICVLCKRKFGDVKKLRQHEKLSPLHKRNLLMVQQKKANRIESHPSSKVDANDTLSVEYRDRAKERRSMYGPESASGTSPGPLNSESVVPTVEMGPSLTNARVVTDVETITPSQCLGETNIGNQLLQKLGWTKGSSLGRNGVVTDGVETIDPNGKNEDSRGISTTTIADKLKQDWERIETLAGGGGRRNTRYG